MTSAFRQALPYPRFCFFPLRSNVSEYEAVCLVSMPPSAESDRWKVARRPPDRRGQNKRLDGVTVLLAEDNPDGLTLLEELLRAEGATCVATCCGRQAFDDFSRQRPDVLIADIWMPDGDGFELIRRIRALEPEQGGLIPAIALSGSANVEQAIMAGYHVMLAKPFDNDQLVDLIDDFIRVDEATPSPRGPWTISSPTPGQIALTYVGHVRASDVRASMEATVRHLRGEPVWITADLRAVTGFALTGAYVAQRIMWPHRDSIAHVRIVARPSLASIMASAACHVLGVGCTMEIV
jgi:CheY-like chemotaxis protein